MNNLFDNTLLSDDTPSHIRGISCSVRSCIYHDGDAFCTAERISVGPSYANSCSETSCATFRARNENL